MGTGTAVHKTSLSLLAKIPARSERCCRVGSNPWRGLINPWGLITLSFHPLLLSLPHSPSAWSNSLLAEKPGSDCGGRGLGSQRRWPWVLGSRLLLSFSPQTPSAGAGGPAPTSPCPPEPPGDTGSTPTCSPIPVAPRKNLVSRAGLEAGTGIPAPSKPSIIVGLDEFLSETSKPSAFPAAACLLPLRQHGWFTLFVYSRAGNEWQGVTESCRRSPLRTTGGRICRTC